MMKGNTKNVDNTLPTDIKKLIDSTRAPPPPVPKEVEDNFERFKREANAWYKPNPNENDHRNGAFPTDPTYRKDDSTPPPMGGIWKT
jgi:hypothetical protein